MVNGLSGGHGAIVLLHVMLGSRFATEQCVFKQTIVSRSLKASPATRNLAEAPHANPIAIGLRINGDHGAIARAVAMA